MSQKKKPIIKDFHTIYDAKTMMVIASPTRFEVLNAICALGECSIQEIASYTGRARTSLYPHVQQLVDAKLVVESKVRLSGKRYEQVYQPIARTVATKHNLNDPENIAYHQAYGNAVARLMARLHERATADPDSVVRGPERDTFVSIHSVWVDDESLTKINGLIEQVLEICESSMPDKDSTDKRLVNISVILAPDRRAEN